MIQATAMVVALAATASAARAQGSDDLRVVVQYPNEGAVVAATDSTFVFGRVEGAAGAAVALTVNGAPVPVHAGGGWLAFVPIAPDSFAFDVRAVAAGRETSTRRTVWVPPPPERPGGPNGFKPETIAPRGPIEAYAGDTVRVRVVAAPDRRITARLGEERTTLVPASSSDAHDWRAYAGQVYLRLSGSIVDTLTLEIADAGGAIVEAPVAEVRFLDPTETRVAILDDDPDRQGGTDGRVVARAGPGRGYTMLLPNGTVATLGRRHGDQQQILLGPGRTAWVAHAETRPLVAPRPESTVSAIRNRVIDGWSEIVVPLTARLPFRIEQRIDPVRYKLTIFGAIADTDWVRYDHDDRWVESIAWRQAADGVYQVDVRLTADQAWGYRARWEGTDLVLSMRHPPAALADGRFRSALHGVRVVVDPGHNPDPGAIGPTGLEERDVNLEIARTLADLLEARGADVVMTRADADSALGLYDRTAIATRAGGEIFVSIHNNALPDGINPFLNNGTSTFFYHPQSRPLAEAILERLIVETGLRDFQAGEGNLAVARMNEMPAVLVEGAFMMIPEQEARLRTPAFQRRIAMAVADGIERFLEQRNH